MKRSKSFDNSKPLLYLVATPIGNLSEVSKRTLEVFSLADIIAAEDTRNTYSLLSNFGIKKELFSLREHNEKEASLYLINKIKEGKKVVYVSDAGYPGISDPGSILVKEAIAHDIAVSTVSGPSAFINALVASGLETSHFYYYGFLSAKDNEARSELEQLKDRKETIIFYESPHRIKRSLENLKAVLGNRNITLARELTKLNEEYIRGTLDELCEIDESTLKGEMVLIVEGNKEEKLVTDNDLLNRFNQLLDKGISKKTAAEIVSEEYKVNKNYVKKLTQ